MKKLNTRYVRALMMSLLVTLACPVISTAYTLQEEIDLGAKIDTQILKQTPLATDQNAQKEIDRVGQLIVKNGGLKRPQIAYHFKVITGDDLNAFSTPGGYVYFTERIWNVLRPDERAGVLAHEIVHADRRHALDAMLKNQKRSTILGILLILTGAKETVADVVSIGNQIYTLKYSRGDERQADEIGTQLLISAKMNPAGLLLAMRKIDRFQAEAGGKVPTILSSHPDTGDRLKYLEQYLRNAGVPVPPDSSSAKNNSNKIGSVTGVTGNRIGFSSSVALKPGDIVWLMGKGWDYYYESQTGKPVGRIIVTNVSTRNGVTGTLYRFDDVKPEELSKAVDVALLPIPAQGAGIATMTSVQLGGVARIQSDNGKPLIALERLLAVSPVWDAKSASVVNDNIGYIVVTDPGSTSGFMTASRVKYSYAPVNAGAVLERVKDPNSGRWVGTVLSIGAGSGKVEVLPNRQLSADKTYEVVAPPWSKDVTYEQRVIGSTKLAPRDKNKIVMKITKYVNGYNIHNVGLAYDIYEAETPKSSQ